MLYRLRLTIINRPTTSLLLFVAGLFVGAATTLNIIGAQSFLLSSTSPVYLVYMTALSGIAFSIMVRIFSAAKLRMATLSIIMALLAAMSLYALLYFTFTPFILSLLWMFIALFTMQLFFWMMDEMIVRHVATNKASSHLYYIFVTYEIGTLLMVLSFMYRFTESEPHHFMIGALACFVIFALLMLLSFTKRRHGEIDYHSTESVSFKSISPAIKRSIVILALTSFCIGVIETLTTHSVNLTLQDQLQRFSSLRDTFLMLHLFGSIVLMILSGILGVIMHKLRLAPTTILFLHLAVIASFVGICLTIGTLHQFMALQIILWTSMHILHHPAIQMLHISFPVKERSYLASIQQFAYLVLPTIILGLILTTTIHIPYNTILPILLTTILGITAITMILLWIDFKQLVTTFKEHIDHGSKEAAILAIDALAYLHPRSYAKWMMHLLASHPKKLIQKSAILGLSYHKDTPAITTICEQFPGASEEIQQSVIDSLARFKTHAATDYIEQIAFGEIPTISTHIRLYAITQCYRLRKKSTIERLQDQLDDPDARKIADSIEALGTLKHKKSLEKILSFFEVSNSRIRANAIIASAQLSPKTPLYIEALTQMLSSNQPADIASGLYAAARIKSRIFVPHILALSESSYIHNPKVKYCFAFTLTNFDIVEGYQMYNELFAEPVEEGKPKHWIHMFAQLEEMLRFDVIEYILRHHLNDEPYLQNLYQHLKDSGLDFHRELEIFRKT